MMDGYGMPTRHMTSFLDNSYEPGLFFISYMHRLTSPADTEKPKPIKEAAPIAEPPASQDINENTETKD